MAITLPDGRQVTPAVAGSSNPCCGQPSIKQLTTDSGMVYACERCSRHWFRTYENAAGMCGEQERCPPDETDEHDVWCPMGSPSLTCTCAERKPALKASEEQS